MITAPGWETPIEEDPRTQWRRRIQQRRCLVCASRALANQKQSYFCPAHLQTHRYCSTCQTLRTKEEHGASSRCMGCSAARSLAAYQANPDRAIYRIRLREISERRQTREEQIFESMRRRIALAAFVAATPGMSWPKRAALVGGNKTKLADDYRRQVRGDVRDPDAPELARKGLRRKA